ncbi:unnamed protein product, partial [Brassica rapa]
MIDAASTAKSTTSSSNNHYIADVANLTSFRVLVMRPSCLFRWELYPFFQAFDNITVASPPPPPPLAARPPAVDQASTIHNEDSKGISVGIVAAITIPNITVLILMLVVGTFLWRRRKLFNRTENECDTDISAAHSSQYDFKTIEAATNKFSSSNKLGEGGFGRFTSGTAVAVKRLSKTSGQGIREFKNEAVLVSKLQHRNLVRLLGFCVEGEKKILIYEFVPNKSLNHFIFGMVVLPF